MCPEEDYSTVFEMLAFDVKVLRLELKKNYTTMNSKPSESLQEMKIA